ncbi:hypothetical protein HYFRA_00010597 [Hymenoscyphus fraxineus]|uniref:Exosome complex protein n=1 Tax=Hymenoscyphus fraxineus TaxID=746836 RepID=A0A9N9L8U9_9HELO|nr:hypothetical protein HYFRA_00010597 [Hymenoscyphus fraxineus]
MDSSKVLSLVDQLDDDIDDLEEALGPLIKTALSETTSKLPLLDKAKLYVLVTYAIESILFSYLRVNGVNAREHPVFKELTRVKQYFDKIKNTGPPAPRTHTLDKAAAARFINPGLAAAEREALKQAEAMAKQRARAHIKFEELNKEIAERENSKKRKGDTSDEVEGDDDSSSEESSEEVPATKETPVVAKPSKAARKKRKVNSKSPSSGLTSGASSSAEKKGKGKKKNKKTKKGKGKAA